MLPRIEEFREIVNGISREMGCGSVEDVPLGQQDLDGEEEEDTGDGTSKIEEEEVPLAQANLEEEGGMHTAPLIAAGVVVAAGAAGGLWYFLKRKR